MLKKINYSNWLYVDKNYNYAFQAIFGFALIIRLLGIHRGIWLDEDFTIHMISQKTFWEMLQDLRFDTHPPLYYILLYYWSKISNTTEFLRLLSVFIDMGTLIAVMKWMKLYSPLASILAGIYFASAPIMLRFSLEVRDYPLLIFATALSFFFASHLALQPEKSSGYIGLSFSLIIAVLTHLVGVMLIASICIFTVLIIEDIRKIQWNKAIPAIAIPYFVFILIYLFYLVRLNDNVSDWWMPFLSPELISSTTEYILGFSSVSLPIYLEDITWIITFTFIGVILIFGKSRSNYPFLVAVAVYWLQIIGYSILKTQIFWYRTLLPSLLPLIGFVILQIVTIQRKKIRTICVIIFTAITLIFTANWIISQAWKPVEEFRQVAQLLVSKWQPNNIVIFYPDYIESTVRYYFLNLPSKNVLKVGIKADIKNIISDIDKISSALNKKESQSNIFLIERVDLSLRKDIETYSKLLDAVESKFTKPLVIQVCLILSHDLSIVRDFDTVPKILATLQSKLGQPLSYQNFDSYILSKYEWPNRK